MLDRLPRFQFAAPGCRSIFGNTSGGVTIEVGEGCGVAVDIAVAIDWGDDVAIGFGEGESVSVGDGDRVGSGVEPLQAAKSTLATMPNSHSFLMFMS